MRIWKFRDEGDSGGVPPASDPAAAVVPPDPPTEGPPPSDALPVATLDDLYYEDGTARYETNEGIPCDLEGNPIAAVRPGTVPAPPAPEEAPAPAPAPAPQVFRSPFADGLLNDEERLAAEQLVDPQALALIETMAARIAHRTIAAAEQQRIVARQVGIPAELVDEYAPRMNEMQQYVPPQLRGTREGAVFAAALAAAQEGVETGDIGAVFRKLGGASSTPPSAPAAPPASARQALPPSAATHIPAGSPDATRGGRTRPQRTVAGLSPEQLAVINEQRAMRNGGGR